VPVESDGATARTVADALAAVWAVTKKKVLEARPFAVLSEDVVAAVEAEARRLAPFVGEGIRVAVIPAR
jgi:hypothetical protein